MKLLYILPFILSSISYSQVGIGASTLTTDTSTLLDISSTSKGFLIPRIAFTSPDLTSTTIPVVNPAEGLIVYNTDNTYQLTGLYLFTNGTWKILSENTNKTSDLLIFSKGSSQNFTPTATFNDFNISNFKSNVLVNTTSAVLATGDPSTIRLEKGNYYLILTINASTIETVNGINSKGAHTHGYRVKVVTNTGADIPSAYNYDGNISSYYVNPKHTLIAKISFKLSTTTDIKLQIAKNINNSTYTGIVNYTDASIRISKSISK